MQVARARQDGSGSTIGRARRRGRALALALLATSGLAAVPGLPSPALAASASFDIRPQPLSQALMQFSNATGVQLFFNADLVRGLQSPGAQGALSRTEALDRLLAGSGLTFRFTNANTVTIQRAAGAAPPLVTGAVAGSDIVLDTIDVQGGSQSPYGPGVGFVATRTVTGSKSDTPLIQIPQSISVVTQDQIAQQGAQNLKQALGYTTGVASNTRTAFSGFDIMYSRGFILDRYVDGTKLLGGVSGYTVPQIEPYGVERLEVLRGPASVLYGQSSPGGLVNAVTKRPRDTAFREVELQTGNFGRLQGAFDIGGPTDASKTLLYRFTGLVRDVDSQVDFTKQQRFYFAPALTWRPDDSTSLTVMANIQHDPYVGLYSLVPASGTVLPNRYGRIPVSRYLGDPNYNVYRRDQQSISYAFEHRFDDVWTIRQNFRFMHTDGVTEQLLPLGTSLVNGRTLNRYALYDANNINGLTLDNQAQAVFATGPLSHTLLLGFDLQRLSESDTLGQAVAPSIDVFAPAYGKLIPMPPIVSNTNQAMWQLGAYVQDQIKFDRFVLTLSGRKDWVSTDTANDLKGTTVTTKDDAFTWRAGLNYVFDNGIAPYVAYATSFAPTVGTDVSGNPFKPTTGQQYEAGIKYQPVGVNALFTFAAFDLTQQNVLTINPNNTAFRIQTGEIRSRGVEAEARASLADGLDLIATYSYAHVEVTRSNSTDLGKRPVNIPNQMASLWLFKTMQSGPFLGLGLGAGVRYVGNTPGDQANTFFVPSNALVDVAVRYDIGERVPELKGLTFTLNATNLLDQRYVSECSNGLNCLYGPGRTVIAGLKYQW